jgi:hypothetical protein
MKTKEVDYERINDGFVYLNTNSLGQMSCVYYPEQDNWYIYGYLNDKPIDVKTINNSDFKILLCLIDKKLSMDQFISIMINTGYQGYYPCNLYFELKKTRIDFNDFNIEKSKGVIYRTLTFTELLDKSWN